MVVLIAVYIFGAVFISIFSAVNADTFDMFMVANTVMLSPGRISSSVIFMRPKVSSVRLLSVVVGSFGVSCSIIVELSAVTVNLSVWLTVVTVFADIFFKFLTVMLWPDIFSTLPVIIRTSSGAFGGVSARTGIGFIAESVLKIR